MLSLVSPHNQWALPFDLSHASLFMDLLISVQFYCLPKSQLGPHNAGEWEMAKQIAISLTEGPDRSCSEHEWRRLKVPLYLTNRFDLIYYRYTSSLNVLFVNSKKQSGLWQLQ